jgi:predicted amidohydrolase
MKIISLQLPVALADLERNKKTFLDAIAQLSDEKDVIIVLPEMWSCGFDYENLQQFALKTDEVISEIQSIINSDTLVVTTHPEENQNKVFNTVYAVTKDGVIGKYRKNLLFSPTGEDKYFDVGSEVCVVDFKGMKVGLLVCYEIRFPELFRMTAAAGADVITVPAMWPAMKKEHWQTLTRARAIENQLYVVGGNCSVLHTRKKTMDCGYSVAWNPWGEALFEPADGDAVLSCTADRADVEDIREKIPSMQDALKTFKIERR